MNLSPGKVLGILTAVGPGPGRRVYGNSSPARVALAGLALTPGPHFSATLLPPASCSTQHSSGTPDAKKPLKLISPAGEPFEMPHQDKKCADYAVSRRVWSPSARHARPDGTAQNPKLSCSLQNFATTSRCHSERTGPQTFSGGPKECSLLFGVEFGGGESKNLLLPCITLDKNFSDRAFVFHLSPLTSPLQLLFPSFIGTGIS